MKKLTLRQSRFLKEYFKTGNGTRAAMKTYNCKDAISAAEIASQNLRKLKDVVKTWMDLEGLTLKKIVGKVEEATSADKIVTSHTEPDYTVPDHPTRLKAVEIAGKWLGMEQPQTMIQVNIKPILGGRSVQGSPGNEKVIEAQEAD